ncbi:MAG TPA: hypothetical protein DER33_09665 [Syntrophomonas sp.]|jgi:polyhydroxyalkanoate synthesis regulator phasin|nr:hypothetical protein [Peptococcaceae bacterium]HBQ85327.1 hypothetical protein [Syntrophomonas sp.]HCF71830.1 hypothetical protein [Syntrophomonas sp.]
MSFMKKAFYLGLGALCITREKAEKFISELEEKGEMSKEEGKEFLEEVMQKGEEQKKEIHSMIAQSINEFKGDLGAVSRAEFQALEDRIQKLEEKSESE